MVDRNDQRDKAADGEIDMAKSVPGCIKHVGEGEFDRFAVG